MRKLLIRGELQLIGAWTVYNEHDCVLYEHVIPLFIQRKFLGAFK